MLKPSPVFCCRQLPYHLVQRCLHCSANHPGMHPSRWDHPLTLHPVDICATFLSHSPVHQIDIRNGFHHVDLHDDIYKHPHHKSRFLAPDTHWLKGTRGCRQESSLKRRGYRSCSPPGQCIVWGGGLAHQCPFISLTDTYHRYQCLMHCLSILWSYSPPALVQQGVSPTLCLFGTLVL